LVFDEVVMKIFKFKGAGPPVECFEWLKTHAGGKEGMNWDVDKRVESYDTNEQGENVIGARWVTVIRIHDDALATMFALRWL